MHSPRGHNARAGGPSIGASMLSGDACQQRGLHSQRHEALDQRPSYGRWSPEPVVIGQKGHNVEYSHCPDALYPDDWSGLSVPNVWAQS